MSSYIGLITDAQHYAFAFQPLLLVTIKQNDGTVLNLCTHDLTEDPDNNVLVGGFSVNAPRSFSLPEAVAKKINPDIVGDVEYLARITNQDIAATQALSEDGIDITPTVTLRIADPDQELFTNFELNSVLGFKGAELTLTLVLVDMAGYSIDPHDSTKAIFASSFSTDVLGCFIGQCNPATQDSDMEMVISAVSKLNMKRIMLPSIAVQKRCPWVLPRRYTTYSTDSQGNLITTVIDEWVGERVSTNSGTGLVTTKKFPGASDPRSQFYYCGFDNGLTRGSNLFPDNLTLDDWTNKSAAGYGNGGAKHCQYTKQGCIALGMYGTDSAGRHTGSFGGFQYDMAANNMMNWAGKSYIEGVHMEGVGSRALAKYNNYVPLVYGTAWVDAIVMNVAGDPNSTRGEAVCCSEEVGEVVVVMVNDIMCPPARQRYTGNSTPQTPVEAAILADYGQALDNAPYVDSVPKTPIAYVWNTTPIIVELQYGVKLTTGDYVYVWEVGGYQPPTNSIFGAIFGTNTHTTNSANGLWTIVADNKDPITGLVTKVALIGSSSNMIYQGGGNTGWLATANNPDASTTWSSETIKTFRWEPINYGTRDGQPLGDAPFNSAGDPYGNFCAIEWVVPISVAQSNVVPSVKALVDGPKIPVFTDTLGSYDGTNESLIEAYAKMGSPYNENPVWQILNVLIRSGWSYDKIDLKSFVVAARVCQELISYTDQFGNVQKHPRFACSFTISKRKPVADVLRALRTACGAILLPGSNGLLKIVIKQDIGRQQPNPVIGSNYNSPIPVGIPSQYLTGPSMGHVYYDFTEADILRDGSKTSFKVHQLSIQQTPNKIQVSFQDKENAYQQDGLTIIDDYDYNNVGEVDTQLQMEGPNTYDHVQRIVTTMLAEYHKGNPSAQSHGTLQFTFDTTYRASHLKIGDIVRLTFAQRGINQQLCRVMSIAPTQNFEGMRIMMQWHDDIWYSDAFGQGLIQDSGSLGANSVNRPPFAWQPWQEQPNSLDPLDPPTEWNFAISQSYIKNADDSQTAMLNIAGKLPINQFSQKVRRPIVPPQGSFSMTGGTFAGPQTYFVAVCAVDADGKYSAPSQLVRISVTQWTSTASLTVKNIICDPKTSKVAIFAGASQQTMTFHRMVTPSSMAKFEASVSDRQIRTWGMPDVALNSINIKAKRIVHSGPFGVAISDVGAGTIKVADAGWTTDMWKGRQCTVISHLAANGANPLPIWNFKVLSNTEDTLSVSPDPLGETVVVEVGDALVMRFQALMVPVEPSNGTGDEPVKLELTSIHKITDPRIINSLNGFGEPFDVSGTQDNGDGTTTVYTSDPHGFDGAHMVYVQGVGGAFEVNGRWPVIVVSEDSATSFVIPVSSSLYQDGGTCAQQILGMIPHAESGNIFRVIGGPGTGASASIADNDETSLTLAQPLSSGIDESSIWIIEEGSWTFTQNSGTIKNSTAPTADGTAPSENPPMFSSILSVDNWVGDTLLVMGVSVDVNGNEAPEAISPLREAYMLGAGGATFIRDWLCKGIISDDPMAVGTDVMVNHYRVRVNKGEYVQLLDVAIQAKSAPLGADAVFDILASTDNGATWETIFKSTIHLPISKTGASYPVFPDLAADTFAIPRLYRDNLLRFDVKQIGSSVAGGQVELDLKGKVFA